MHKSSSTSIAAKHASVTNQAPVEYNKRITFFFSLSLSLFQRLHETEFQLKIQARYWGCHLSFCQDAKNNQILKKVK